MSEKRRHECLKLAIKAGATPENAVRIAKDFESWVGEFQDPLKLDAKSPDSESLSAEWRSRNLGKQELEIDWSRRQIVRRRDDFGNLLVTTGKASRRFFEAHPFAATIKKCDYFDKSDFSYHGEIPESTPELKTPTIEELAKEVILKCKDACYSGWGRHADNKLEGDYGTWDDWEMLLIQFANDVLVSICGVCTEPKITGLTFMEAISIPSRKFEIKRASKNDSHRLYYGNRFGRPDTTMFEATEFTLDDFLATDWQIIDK
jgi:hypothetical protein